MAKIDAEQYLKLKKGETAGLISTAVCAAAVIYFAVVFSIGWVRQNALLQTLAWAIAPAAAAISVAFAAFCNIKFGRKTEKLVKNYVRDVLIENAAAMHPEKESISFLITVREREIGLKANNHKDEIIFDLSELGKISSARKLNMVSAIEETLVATFIRLYERGSVYKSVDYGERSLKGKRGKTVYIIKDGKPETAAYKRYLKNK